MQTGLFDLEFRLEKIDANGDPLKKLNDVIDWEIFRAELEAARDKERKSPAGRKPYDAVLMFKVLILQSLYCLSDDATEYQVLDRLSFMRFLGLEPGSAVPDAKTIWLFRDQLTQAEQIHGLFDRFDGYLSEHGYVRASCRRRSSAIRVRRTRRSSGTRHPSHGRETHPSYARRTSMRGGRRKARRVSSDTRTISAWT
jgi:hypothetical protein